MGFELMQNYPNPFNASTTISYSLLQSSTVTLEIYDILGRKLETFNQGTQPAGSHSVIWKANQYPSGVYFYRLQAGDFNQNQKMILLK
jgi:hypothetical protein